MNSTSIRLYLVFNVFSAFIAIVFNFLAISLPLNNKTTSELSDKYENFFVPAGFTFSIWGIIYLMMISFILYQLYQFSKKETETLENIITIGPWFFISGLANAFWIISWHYEFIFSSIVIMTVLLGSLLKIYFLLKKFRPLGIGDNIFILTFFSTYTAWISVAMIANVTAALVSVGWNGGMIAGNYWACIMIMIATILGVIFVYRYKDIPYALVIVWALYGIYSKQSSQSDNMSNTVAIFAKYAGTMLLIYTVLLTIGKKTYYHHYRKAKILAN